jgi:hypothetical protein
MASSDSLKSLSDDVGATAVLDDLAKLDSYSTFILNVFPLCVSIFITFYGRFFDNLLRLISVFFIVITPIGAEVLTPWLTGAELALDAGQAVTLLWAVLAGLCGVYVAVKRRELGIKLQLVGVSCAAVMVINSYYIGYIHQNVKKELPGISQWFDWLNTVMVVLASGLLIWLRDLPIVGEILTCCVCAIIGGCMTLQTLDAVFTDINISVTEGLGWTQVLDETFGCVHLNCSVFMTVMVCFTGVGAFNNYVMWKHHIATVSGKHSRLCVPIMTYLYHKIEDRMAVLFNLNEAVAVFSRGLSEEVQSVESLKVQRDMYIVLDFLTGVYICLYALALLVHSGEMWHRSIFSYEDASAFFVVVSILCIVVAVGTAAIVIYIRFGIGGGGSHEVGSDTWKVQTHRYIVYVGVTWPILLFGFAFLSSLGGHEAALLSIPQFNEAAGFDTLPFGCSDIRKAQKQEAAATQFCTWAGDELAGYTRTVFGRKRVSLNGAPTTTARVPNAELCAQAVAIYRANVNSQTNAVTFGIGSGKNGECWAEIGLNGTHAPQPVKGVDSFQTCMPSLAHFKSMQHTATKRCTDGMMNHGEHGVDCGGSCPTQCGSCQCSYTGRSGLVDTGYKGCGTHFYHNITGTIWKKPVLDYVCFVVDPAACQQSGGLQDNITTHRPVSAAEKKGARWKFCSPYNDKLNEWGNSKQQAQPLPPPPPVVPQQVWKCAGAKCTRCNTRACLVDDCESANAVHVFFPITSKILGKLVLAIVLSVVTISGELGGFYAFATRFTTYVTSINLIQGIFIVVFGSVMEYRSMPDLEAESSATADGLVKGEVEFFVAVILIGAFLILQSLMGLIGVCCDGKAIGGGCLKVYKFSVLLTFLAYCCLFAAAAYYILNIETNIDDDWDKHILPRLQAANNTVLDETGILKGMSRVSKEKFVTYAKGSFKLIMLIGAWFIGYSGLLLMVTQYTVQTRLTVEGDHARAQKKKKQAVANPMFGEEEELEEALTPRAPEESGRGGVARSTVNMAAAVTSTVASAGVTAASGAAKVVAGGNTETDPPPAPPPSGGPELPSDNGGKEEKKLGKKKSFRRKKDYNQYSVHDMEAED